MKSYLAGAALVLLTVSTAVGQQQKAPAAQGKAPADVTRFTTKAAAGNAFEIQSSELADTRAERDDVKTFARQMVADHGKARTEMDQVLQSAGLPAPEDRPDAFQRATLKRLEAAKGKAFDRAYIDAQVKAHKDATSLFRTYSKSGQQAELKEFAARTLPTPEQHYKMIQDIAKQRVSGK